MDSSPVLLTGATGFIGSHTYGALEAAGYQVRCGTRQPERMRSRHPTRDWRRLDLDAPETLEPALEGARAAIYLVHQMAESGDYEVKEQRSAERFLRAAERCGIERLVYLGGVVPAGAQSKHLRSRIRTGEILRGGRASTIELRAGMIIGPGGESWRIVRDLAVRLPFMVLPKWLESSSQPVALDDVVAAIVHALGLPLSVRGAFDIPGPETLTGREILERIASLTGTKPYMLKVPVLTPRLSSYWLKLVTRANFRVAQELVKGLTSDLVAQGEGFWTLMPEHARIPFDEAARRALKEEAQMLSPRMKLVEDAIHRVTRRAA